MPFASSLAHIALCFVCLVTSASCYLLITLCLSPCAPYPVLFALPPCSLDIVSSLMLFLLVLGPLYLALYLLPYALSPCDLSLYLCPFPLPYALCLVPVALYALTCALTPRPSPCVICLLLLTLFLAT